MYEFDEDTRVARVGPGRYAGRLTDRWDIGGVPNGGYVLAVAMSALRQALPSPDPLTVTSHYLGPSAPGPVSIDVETIKVGRRYSTAMARVVQGDRETVRVLATYGNLRSHSGPTYIFAEPPLTELPDHIPRDSRVAVPAFAHRFEIRSNNLHFMLDRRSERAEVSGWLRFADGRFPDVHTLGLIADAFPPAALQVIEPGWVPTLELTVHFRAHPSSDWLRCVFRTRFIFGGLLEEDGEIWDEGGSLVAMSRQLAAMPRRP